MTSHLSFSSEIRNLGKLDLPGFTGTRVMMMPFLLEEPEHTLPDMLASWRPALAALSKMSPAQKGVAYLTIDEALVKAGETHRRPGLHVDGVGPDGGVAGWAAAPWSSERGMLLIASHVGCRGWQQDFLGAPLQNGDCAHLVSQCREEAEIVMQPGQVYWCGPLTVHESIPAKEPVKRQFVRLSMPSTAPWYEGYTENPLGIKPTGPIHPRRSEFMEFRRLPSCLSLETSIPRSLIQKDERGVLLYELMTISRCPHNN